MNGSCSGFRAALERALGDERVPIGRGLAGLALNGHLPTCGACRDLLESEQALEALLSGLPDPALPPEVAVRLRARLAREREELALDRLLDLLPDPGPPAGLAERTMAGLRGAGRSAGGRARRPLRRLALAAAAALVLSGSLWLLLRGRAQRLERLEAPVAEAPGDPPPPLLQDLELLENWDLIHDGALETWLSTLDDADAVLLELDAGLDPLALETSPPSQG